MFDSMVQDILDELLGKLKELKSTFKGLSSRAIINYLLQELDENSLSKCSEILPHVLSQVLPQALSLIDNDVNELVRLKNSLLEYAKKLNVKLG